MKNLHIIAGLPRSGSSLLVNVLNSNPNFHATPTSGVLDVLKNIRSTVSHNTSFKAQNRLDLMKDIANGMKGFLDGYFASTDGTVFDKCRGWSNYLQLLDEILGHNDTKIVWVYRDPVDVVNSIESKYQKTILLENVDEIVAPDAFATIDRRIAVHFGLLDGPVETLRDAIEMGYGHRIMMVKYDVLCSNPQGLLNDIHNFIGEDIYQYDLDNVKQTIHEEDSYYNYKFSHNIKEGKIEPSETKLILPIKYQNIISERYSKLNDLINKGDINNFIA